MTAEIANAQLRSLVAELEKWGYMANVNFHAYAVPVQEQITGRVKPVLLVVFGAVVFVMLIACALIGFTRVQQVIGDTSDRIA